MNTGKKYRTKQQMLILDSIKACRAGYIQISEMLQILELQSLHIGVATAYRNLNKLVDEGRVRKINVEGIAGACYQYVPEEKNDGFSLKCEGCNRILDMECTHINELYEHIMEQHNFNINPGKTIFYGLCEQCKAKR